jgi:hypothetical protein
VAAVASLVTGCTVARQLTTRRLNFTENLIPTRNHGSSYSTGLSDTGGPIGPLPFDIQITGEVRDKYDKYHGGVDYSYLTYRATSTANAPVRVRLWASLANSLNACPQIENGQVPETATLILDVTIPPKGTIDNQTAEAHNIETLRQIVEALLLRPYNAAACVYTQAESEDKTGNVTITQLDVRGRAHGSLF